MSTANSPRYRVLVPTKAAPDMLAVLREYAALDVDAAGDLTQEQLEKAIATADAVVIRSNNEITAQVLAAATRLRVVGRAGTGVDNVDVDAATQRGVLVMNTPGANSISTAEHTLSMMLALARRIPAADRSVKAGKWERGKFQGVELYGKTLGIVGLGRIGVLIARRAAAFGMKVMAYDPFVAPETLKDTSLQMAPLDDVLRAADFITVHTPLTPKTTHLISGREFALMRPGVRILNCARGGIVDEDALCDAIDAGKVAGAALDVFEQEPPAGSRVVGYDQIVMTPHLGASTEEAQRNVGIAIARQVAEFLCNGVISGAVNAHAVSGEAAAAFAPYFDLCQKMGSMAAQMVNGAPRRVTITFHGERFAGDVDLLVAIVLEGVLSHAVEGGTVSLVNSRALAKERGIEVEVVHGDERDDFASLVRVRVEAASGSHELAGSQFGKHTGHVVRIDEFPVEVEPRGAMIVTLSDNQPGVIGRMGTIVGKHGGNINKMNNGSAADGARALSTMSLDVPPGPALLEELGREPYFHWIRLVQL